MIEQHHLEGLKPDDGLGALYTISEQIDALGYNNIRLWLLEELCDDVSDVDDGILSIRSLRFVLKTLKLKHFDEFVRSTKDGKERGRRPRHDLRRAQKVD